MTESLRAPYDLPPLPHGGLMRNTDERVVRAPTSIIFALARDVEYWPAHMRHYRSVRFRERARDGGGLVSISASRPFGPLGWPTRWLCEMAVDVFRPAIRFRHVEGLTRGMEVEWQFKAIDPTSTRVRVIHVWGGPNWPVIGEFAATSVIGPVFVHNLAVHTLAGLAAAAEREAADVCPTTPVPIDPRGPQQQQSIPA